MLFRQKNVCKITKLQRRAHWFYSHKLKFIAVIIFRYMRLLYSCCIPYTCEISPTVNFPHNALGVTINASAVIEDGCVIYQGTTIGNRKSSSAPHLEKGVFVGANCTILGPITIGKNAKIGAGTIVTQDVPCNATVVMPRPRIIIREENQ